MLGILAAGLAGVATIFFTIFYTFFHRYNSNWYMANANRSGIFDFSIGNLYHSFHRGVDVRKVSTAMAMGGHERGEWPG